MTKFIDEDRIRRDEKMINEIANFLSEKACEGGGTMEPSFFIGNVLQALAEYMAEICKINSTLRPGADVKPISDEQAMIEMLAMIQEEVSILFEASGQAFGETKAKAVRETLTVIPGGIH